MLTTKEKKALLKEVSSLKDNMVDSFIEESCDVVSMCVDNMEDFEKAQDFLMKEAIKLLIKDRWKYEKQYELRRNY